MTTCHWVAQARCPLKNNLYLSVLRKEGETDDPFNLSNQYLILPLSPFRVLQLCFVAQRHWGRGHCNDRQRHTQKTHRKSSLQERHPLKTTQLGRGSKCYTHGTTPQPSARMARGGAQRPAPMGCSCHHEGAEGFRDMHHNCLSTGRAHDIKCPVSQLSTVWRF